MERKVIKFNLVGAICVIVLIIAIIIGIIIMVTNNNKANKNDEKESFQDNKEEYNELDSKEYVRINGETKELTMKKFNSKFKYTMNYDVDSFYIDTNIKNKDSFKSLISSTILVEVQEFNEKFENISNKLIFEESSNRESRENYKINIKDLNGKTCYIEQETIDNDIVYNYYIDNNDKYFLINVKCGSKFIEANMPIIEKMIESFTVM